MDDLLKALEETNFSQVTDIYCKGCGDKKPRVRLEVREEHYESGKDGKLVAYVIRFYFNPITKVWEGYSQEELGISGQIDWGVEDDKIKYSWDVRLNDLTCISSGFLFETFDEAATALGIGGGYDIIEL